MTKYVVRPECVRTLKAGDIVRHVSDVDDEKQINMVFQYCEYVGDRFKKPYAAHWLFPNHNVRFSTYHNKYDVVDYVEEVISEEEYDRPVPPTSYKVEPDAATLAAAEEEEEEEARSPKKWPDPPAPNPDAPKGDPNARFEFINPTTGEITENLTADEVFALEEQWRADCEARVRAELETLNAAFVPSPDSAEEDQ